MEVKLFKDGNQVEGTVLSCEQRLKVDFGIGVMAGIESEEKEITIDFIADIQHDRMERFNVQINDDKYECILIGFLSVDGPNLSWKKMDFKVEGACQ
jgi:hypothetical protein